MKRFFISITLLIISSTFAFAQSQTNNSSAANSQAEKEVLQMEKEWNDARAKTERAAFERLLADDFIGFTPGQQAEKASLIKGYRAPNLEAILSGDIKVRVIGDTAIVTGWNIRKWRILDRETSPQERFTNVWAKRNGRWQLVSSHWDMRKEGPKPYSGDMSKINDSELKAVAPLGCDQEASLKSLKSDKPTIMKIINSTNQTVTLHWLNYEGKRDLNGYQISKLEAGKSTLRATYLTHPVLVTDESGKCLGIYQPISEPGIAVIK